MIKCECGIEISAATEAEEYEEYDSHRKTHYCQVVKERPLVVVITLPDGCTTGRWEAAEAFAEAVAVLYRSYPGTKFQFTVFDHHRNSDGSLGGVCAWLAVAEPENSEQEC